MEITNNFVKHRIKFNYNFLFVYLFVIFEIIIKNRTVGNESGIISVHNESDYVRVLTVPYTVGKNDLSNVTTPLRDEAFDDNEKERSRRLSARKVNFDVEGGDRQLRAAAVGRYEEIRILEKLQRIKNGDVKEAPRGVQDQFIEMLGNMIPQTCWYKGAKFDCGLSISCVLAGGKPLDLCSGGMIWSCCASHEKVSSKDPSLGALHNATMQFVMNNVHHITKFTSDSGVSFTNNRLHATEQQAAQTVYPNVDQSWNTNKRPNGLSIFINTDKKPKPEVYPNVPGDNPHAFYDRNQNHGNNKNNYYQNNFNNQNAVTKRPYYYYSKPDYTKPSYQKPYYGTTKPSYGDDKPGYGNGYQEKPSYGLHYNDKPSNHGTNYNEQPNYGGYNYNNYNTHDNGGSFNQNHYTGTYGIDISVSNSIYNHNGNRPPSSVYDNLLTSTVRPDIVLRPQIPSHINAEDHQVMESLGHTQGFRGKH